MFVALFMISAFAAVTFRLNDTRQRGVKDLLGGNVHSAGPKAPKARRPGKFCGRPMYRIIHGSVWSLELIESERNHQKKKKAETWARRLGFNVD
jgi:hypothetical protein